MRITVFVILVTYVALLVDSDLGLSGWSVVAVLVMTSDVVDSTKSESPGSESKSSRSECTGLESESTGSESEATG